jgi:hypothetical protein
MSRIGQRSLKFLKVFQYATFCTHFIYIVALPGIYILQGNTLNIASFFHVEMPQRE